MSELMCVIKSDVRDFIVVKDVISNCGPEKRIPILTAIENELRCDNCKFLREGKLFDSCGSGARYNYYLGEKVTTNRYTDRRIECDHVRNVCEFYQPFDSETTRKYNNLLKIIRETEILEQNKELNLLKEFMNKTLGNKSTKNDEKEFLNFIRSELGEDVYKELKRNYKRMKENDN